MKARQLLPLCWLGAALSGLVASVCAADVSNPNTVTVPFTRARRVGEKEGHVYFFGPVRRLTRELKARTSSRLEQCILKATRPDATPVKQKHLDRILGSVSQFDAIRSYYKCEPSKVLVSKLRKRLEEPDWRTVLKSLHIVHRLLQQQKDEEGGKIAAEFRSTAKLGQDPFLEEATEGSEQSERLKVFLKSYFDYLQFRASEANEEITRLLNCSLSRGNATAATPLRRHLASATAALNNLIELGLGCNGLGKDLAEHPIIQPCLACVAEDISVRCETFYDGEFLKPEGLRGDLVEEVLQAEAFRFRQLLPRILPFLEKYGTAEARTKMIAREGKPPQWMARLFEPASTPAAEEVVAADDKAAVEGEEEAQAVPEKAVDEEEAGEQPADEEAAAEAAPAVAEVESGMMEQQQEEAVVSDDADVSPAEQEQRQEAPAVQQEVEATETVATP